VNKIIIKNISIKDAIKQLDVTAKKILFIVNNNNQLIGTLTDGDVRRWILKNGSFNEPVSKIMNRNPIFLNINNKDNAKKNIEEKNIDALPIVNDKNVIVDIIFRNELFNYQVSYYNEISTPVVIMAGGKGTRLQPYTKILPKPLIPIGDTSITERIINRFVKFGIKEFYMTVNYKKNMIKAYFEELEKNYKLHYVEETNFLGTAGSLYLLNETINETFIVTNCDILVEADYLDILNYHKKNKNYITMVTSLKNYEIPYGVIKLADNGDVKQTIEKPEYSFLINAGFYVLEPEVLDDIPKNTFFHITDLINKYLGEGKKVGTYPITENAWLDMGEFKEMKRMEEMLGI